MQNKIIIYKNIQTSAKINVTGSQVIVGRGRKMSFPVSSHDMLKSLSTALVREVIMEGAITRLCMPRQHRITATT